MNFSSALSIIKNGGKVYRDEYGPSLQFYLERAAGDEEDCIMSYSESSGIEMPESTMEVSDILAEDWQVVEV